MRFGVKRMNIKRELENSIEVNGLLNETTIMLSQLLDKEILIKQKEEYERWKSQN